MTQIIKKRNYGIFEYGDIVRCTVAVRGSKGKRFKFTGAIFSVDNDENPLYFELIEIGRGQFRSIKEEFVVKDVAASKKSQAKILAKKIE